MNEHACATGTLKTRGWGAVPVIAIRMGKQMRLIATPDYEQRMGEEGKHVPAWFEAEDCVDADEFRNVLEKLAQASQEPTR